jgi:hypothetical protein
METNYELKHKCLLVPLKAVLLVIAMVLVGFTTYAQQGKTVKAANDLQLIEAFANPSVGTIELAPGYYAYLNIQATSGTKVVKHQNGDGNRSSSGCTYAIIGVNQCYNPYDVYYPPVGDPMVGYSYGYVFSYVDNSTCVTPPVGCCPPLDAGIWTLTDQIPYGVAGVDVIIVNPNDNLSDIYVNKPGKYFFKYTWDPAVNPALTEYAEVETEYSFFGPAELDFDADDVCGTSTELDFVYVPGYDPLNVHTIEWFADDVPYGDPFPITGPTASVENYALTMPWCGTFIISVVYTAPNLFACETVVSKTVEFSCEPTADAGPDVEVCGDLCYTSLVGSTGLYTFSPTHAWSWVMLSGPGTLDFENEYALVTAVCAEDPVCAYGEYEVQFQVQNGLCYDEDEMMLTFYEEPVADAGPDQYLCNTFSFSLAAVPYPYCGTEGVNFWSESYWVVVSKADPAAVITFTPDEYAYNASVTITSAADCPFGAYEFQWVEKNEKPAGPAPADVDPDGCSDEDNVIITIFEDPAPDAGDDMEYCETDINGQGFFMFYLDGTEDVPCNDSYAYTFSWSVVSQPDDCDVDFTPDAIDPAVSITNCTSCPYGDYVFSLKQQNGYFNDAGAFVMVCETTDEVTVTIYEQPTDVDAGDDLLLCNDFAFSLTATGSDYECTPSNWYSWTLVSQPAGAGCEVTIANGTTLVADVTIGPCIGDCEYGEYVFRFTEYNGSADVYCEAWDEVMVTIFEMPEADAGDDVNACVDLAYSPFCYELDGNMDYCYSMYGTWTKSCGPGDVTFRDINDPNTEICFEEPGRYKLTWTLTNDAEGCEDADEVIFDLLEQPVVEVEYTELEAPCDSLCIDLGLANITKYDYFGSEEGECPNFNDMAHWSYIDGPVAGFLDATSVSFEDDTDPVTELCVSYYGAYTVRWKEVNVAVDGESECADYVDIFVEFYETPEPFAGDDDVICGNCYTLQGVQYTYLPEPNQHLNDYYYWESLPTNPCPVTFSNFESLTPMVCIPDATECYGTYGFVLHESNGDCYGSDTVYICFSDVPGDIPVCFWNDPNDCGEFEDYYGPDFIYNGCLQPNEVLEVCAEGYTGIEVTPWCGCPSWFDFYNPDFFGYTFEWSLISPAGTITDSQAGYYDFEDGEWVYPYIYIQWGECCDTARLYLTITKPAGECGVECENTIEYKFYVHHKPCVDIVGPDVAEVGMVTEYCNDCPPNPCILYNWTAEHCGIITDGQGTECIDVLWTDYNVNGGWGQITLTVFDTCTGCCNYDEMMVKIYPTGTLGDASLSGYVYYQNNFLTPLNGVEIQLWNGGIPVQSTTSFNDIEGGNGVGYYEFSGINGLTNFGITASYDAMWYGANATDALAVELRTIGALPGGFAWFLNQPLQEEAMDVNNISGINGTDALWIKQRAISMVNFFPAGDWVFEPGMSSTAGTFDIMTLNAGDANRSNVPNSMKSAPAIALVNDGTMNVVSGQEFELPIRIASANQIGAITLNLEYNSALIEVVDVVSTDGMLDNISNGNVSIAWSNVNPMVVAENDIVLTLKVKALGEISAIESLFNIGLGSEFADQSASVIEPVTLKTFGVTTEPAAEDYFLSTNRPNPFNNMTTISYTMPETGKVKLTVLDMLGQEIAVLVDATQSAGTYDVEFSAAGLATGVYIYKITVDGESRDFISTQRMVISH